MLTSNPTQPGAERQGAQPTWGQYAPPSDDPPAPFGAPRPRVPGSQGPPLNPERRDSEQLWGMLSYLGTIFLGPFPPLAIYLARKRKSPFIRYHSAQALNLSLTCVLYAVSGLIVGGLLALDSAATALIIMIPLALALWIVMLTHLIRGAMAANRGEQHQIPTWICATIAK